MYCTITFFKKIVMYPLLEKPFIYGINLKVDLFTKLVKSSSKLLINICYRKKKMTVWILAPAVVHPNTSFEYCVHSQEGTNDDFV